jgi:hypothetical protein
VHIGSFVGTTTTALTFTQLTGQVIDFDITKAGELLVAVTTDGGVTATERNVTGAVLQTLFTVPFREVQILWGEQANATHYLYPKPTRFLEGALFATDGTRLERLPIDGFGLSATAQAETIIFGKSDGEEYKNTISNTGEIMILPLSSTLPEKCYIHDAEIAYCASSPAAPVSEQLPDSWHQGVYRTNDWLWKVNLTLGTAQALSNLEADSGRTIDAFALQSTANNSAVYFINKNNLTLWTYDLQ